MLAYAAEHKGEIEACAAKSGLVNQSGAMYYAVAAAAKLVPSLSNITVQGLSAAMIDQAIKGFEKEPLMNGDLARLGEQALKSAAKS